jgi:sialate O-acetylesterase
MRNPLLFVVFLALAVRLTATPTLNPLFSDNLVLQRGKPGLIWGKASPGEQVSVSLADKAAMTTADASGAWTVSLELPAAGGPYELRVGGTDGPVLHNVLVGEVWLCSGQSNMAFELSRAKGGEEELKSELPWLHYFKVDSRSVYHAETKVSGSWKTFTPQSGRALSAVAYYFAKRLHEELKVPVGIVLSAQGGSPAESWMGAQALSPLGDFSRQLEEIAALNKRQAYPFGSFLMHWLEEEDQGGKAGDWAKPGLDLVDWGETQLPGTFRDFNSDDNPVIVWFRREISLPDPLPAGAVRIHIGELEKMDTTFINGQQVGLSSWVESSRNYEVPRELLHPGANLVAIRVLRTKANGGFRAKPEAFNLELGDGTRVGLAGTWKAKLSLSAKPPHRLPLDWENYPTMPTVLYNGMLAPIAPFRIAGVLWYQGEANQTNPAQYRRLLPAMIANWRELFGQGELPFYVISLPVFMKRSPDHMGDGWAGVRDAQLDTVRLVPNTGLIVTADTGNPDDIHPTDKAPVGERAALCALAGHYGLPIEGQGPLVERVEPGEGRLRIHFLHAKGGLVGRGASLGEFAIAGADRVWHRAEGHIEGEWLVLSSPAVPKPIAARYACQANPEVGLYNQAGLPASPFRTDSWEFPATLK